MKKRHHPMPNFLLSWRIILLLFVVERQNKIRINHASRT